MRILVACEYSGVVRDAFIARGHDAMSCDLEPSERPGPHYQGDVRDILADGWDMLIGFPPCQYLSYAGGAHWHKPGRAQLREAALEFVKTLYHVPIPRVALENPRGYLFKWRKPDQCIQPFYFGHNDRKATYLWLRGLPPLMAALVLPPPAPYYRRADGRGLYFTFAQPGRGEVRARRVARTFQGVADAMAAQWG